MKKKKWIFCALMAAAIVSLSACGEPAATNSSRSIVSSSTAQSTVSKAEKETAYPLTITTYNTAKEPVDEVFEKAPERVLCNEVNSTETMLTLGLADRIVCAAGVSKEDIREDLQGEFEKIADKVYDTGNADLTKEVAVMQKPDFILAWKSTFGEKLLGDVDYWQENNVNTYMALNGNKLITPGTIENEYADILTIGKIFNVQDKAEALVDEMKAAVQKAEKAAEGKEKQKVLIIDFLGEKIWAYDKDMLAGDMVTRMGGEIIPTSEYVGMEDLIKLDPDVLYVVTYGTNAENQSALKKITENAALSSLKSVKENRVFELPLSEIYTSGIRTIDGLNRLGSSLYPDSYQA